MSELPIPETPEELMPTWVTEALKMSVPLDGAQVVSIDQRVLGDGEGFLGDIVQLSLTFDSDGPRAAEGVPKSVVAKLPKLVNRGMGELLGAYERESPFYDEVAPQIPDAAAG